MFDDNSSSPSGLSNGAKFAILAAIPLIVLGVIYLISPITDIRTTSGAVFSCGNAISPPSNKFNANICGDINSAYMFRGLLTIVAGILVGVAGIVLFGSAKASAPTNATYTPAKPSPATTEFQDSNPGNRGRTRTFD